ncbi:MAG: hypothetical protein ACR2ND_14645 [Solirubrobacteraceae bacterium]
MKMLLAGILGVCTSLLIACGSNSKLISSGNAGPLQNDFDSVASAVSSGDCSGATAAVQKARSDLAALPAATDAGLKSRLRQGVNSLAQRAPLECAQATTQSTASTQSTATTTPTTSTQTTSTQTTTTATTPTTTTDTQTTPPPTDTTTTPPIPDNGGTPVPGGGQ